MRIAVVFFILLVVTALAYQPAWNGGFIWDDVVNVTPPELRSWEGLGRIWFSPGTTEQYYPLLHTAFWIEFHIWGTDVRGYHAAGIIQHSLVALLFGLVMARLGIPGAYLAMGLFALHPVHVESVAWITQQKNTLSGTFFLLAILAWLHFDRRRSLGSYAWALVMYIVALLSKTATSPLPVVLLIIQWWRNGSVSFRKDLLPLVPFFLAGASAGILTAGLEARFIALNASDFNFSILDRILIAGRAHLFQLGKILCPTDLAFIYPRWRIDGADATALIYPIAVLALLGAAFALRRRTRAPLAALLFYSVMILPTLGFADIGLFIYSFVADHWQYLPSLGILALLSASIVTLPARMGWDRTTIQMFGGAICLMLGVMTRGQSACYINSETIYRDTLKKNPECWLAANNLGFELGSAGRLAEARILLERAAALRPQDDLIRTNLRNVRMRLAEQPSGLR